MGIPWEMKTVDEHSKGPSRLLKKRARAVPDMPNNRCYGLQAYPDGHTYWQLQLFNNKLQAFVKSAEDAGCRLGIASPCRSYTYL